MMPTTAGCARVTRRWRRPICLKRRYARAIGTSSVTMNGCLFMKYVKSTDMVSASWSEMR